jgi:hypothetical protein
MIDDDPMSANNGALYYENLTITNVMISEDKNASYVKPKLTPQEVYDLYLADK